MHLSAFVPSFDAAVIHAVNDLARRSPLLDRLIGGLEGDPLLKGGVMVAMLWGAWFRESTRKAADRAVILTGVAAAIASILTARILALSLPFRQRPISTPELHMLPPYGSEPLGMIHWSSFPSDHAALFFCLATTLLLVSRRIGIAAMIYALMFICLPRIYMGDHYPSDILAGALIGAATALVFQWSVLKDGVARFPSRLQERSPGMFYCLASFFSLLMALNFETARRALFLIARALKSHVAG